MTVERQGLSFWAPTMQPEVEGIRREGSLCGARREGVEAMCLLGSADLAVQACCTVFGNALRIPVRELGVQALPGVGSRRTAGAWDPWRLGAAAAGCEGVEDCSWRRPSEHLC